MAALVVVVVIKLILMLTQMKKPWMVAKRVKIKVVVKSKLHQQLAIKQFLLVHLL